MAKKEKIQFPNPSFWKAKDEILSLIHISEPTRPY